MVRPEQGYHPAMTPDSSDLVVQTRAAAVFKPVRSKRAFEEIADRVREMLESGELKVGDRLPPERELSKQLNVSRAALREALRTLEHAGLLVLRPGKLGGAFVADAQSQAISENMSDLLKMGGISLSHLTEARAWIEEVVVRVACERADDADFLALEENVRLAEQLFAEGRMMEKLDANIEFHNVLAAATKNPVLVMMTQTLGNVMRSFAKRLGAETSRSVIRSRSRFIESLRSRDADTAVAEMHEHLRTIQKVYMEFAKAKGVHNIAVPVGPAVVAKSILIAPMPRSLRLADDMDPPPSMRGETKKAAPRSRGAATGPAKAR
jgi:GntR family transcriptional repressor for pyruvate dehydrogenase complex